jgi:hypothetical protein
VRRAAVLAGAMLALAGCVARAAAFDVDDASQRAEHREALAEWCSVVGPCVSGPGGQMPAPDAPPLPEYDEACGYLPPAYGDDC